MATGEDKTKSMPQLKHRVTEIYKLSDTGMQTSRTEGRNHVVRSQVQAFLWTKTEAGGFTD